jgi:hypothetical protein
MARSSEHLMEDEAKLWDELYRLIGSLPEERASEPGYFEEGWSAKDLVAHIGSWLAEAGVVLEQIRFGTYREAEIDVDAMNARFLDAMRDTSLTDVRSQAIAARERMLRAWGALPEESPEADRWIDKTGPAHYEEHLPRLQQWVAELGS